VVGRFPPANRTRCGLADRPVGSYGDRPPTLNGSTPRHWRQPAITRETQDPPGGRIERMRTAIPLECWSTRRCVWSIWRCPGQPFGARRGLEGPLARLNSVGLTSVGDPGDPVDSVGASLSTRNSPTRVLLSVRLYAMIWETGDDFQSAIERRPLIGYGNDFLTVDRSSCSRTGPGLPAVRR